MEARDDEGDGGFQRGSGVLVAPEAESLVEQLQGRGVEEVGSSAWDRQRTHWEKLNLQAHHNALTRRDPFVVEALITHEKMATLIYELLVMEVWRERVLPRIVTQQVEGLSHLRLYATLFHEATLCNLLEIALFYASACEAAGDALLDLVDYCHRATTRLIAEGSPAPPSDGDQFAGQATDVAFRCALCALSILRFLSDHASTLPLSVLTRILDTNDLVCSFVYLVEKKPWERVTKAGKTERYEDGRWTTTDALRVGKHEAQVWLALNNFLVDPDCRSKYDFTSHRKEVLGRLNDKIHEVLVDQIPVLVDLQRALGELSVLEAPHVTQRPAVLLELVPEMHEQIMRGKDWAKIAEEQVKRFEESAESREQVLKNLRDMYDLSAIEDVLEAPRCARCGNPATKRCSRCKNEWYCGRECQVAQWKRHKPVCDVVAAHPPPRTTNE